MTGSESLSRPRHSRCPTHEDGVGEMYQERWDRFASRALVVCTMARADPAPPRTLPQPTTPTLLQDDSTACMPSPMIKILVLAMLSHEPQPRFREPPSGARRETVVPTAGS